MKFIHKFSQFAKDHYSLSIYNSTLPIALLSDFSLQKKTSSWIVDRASTKVPKNYDIKKIIPGIDLSQILLQSEMIIANYLIKYPKNDYPSLFGIETTYAVLMDVLLASKSNYYYTCISSSHHCRMCSMHDSFFGRELLRARERQHKSSCLDWSTCKFSDAGSASEAPVTLRTSNLTSNNGISNFPFEEKNGLKIIKPTLSIYLPEDPYHDLHQTPQRVSLSQPISMKFKRKVKN